MRVRHWHCKKCGFRWCQRPPYEPMCFRCNEIGEGDIIEEQTEAQQTAALRANPDDFSPDIAYNPAPTTGAEEGSDE